MSERPPTEQPPTRDQKNLIAAAWQQVESLQRSRDRGAHGDSTGREDTRSQPFGATGPEALPGYRLQGEIHRGGQGVVYRGVQASTQRTVAIKVMRDGPFAGPRERVRFEREVQILAQLKHPNIVTIHDSGTTGSAMYFVMDYIAGEPLDRHVELHTPDLRTRLGLFAKVCAAVNVAHLRGVIHRDLKPGNVRIDAAGEPHVLDFGLAKHAEWFDADSSGEIEALTMTGQFVGSLPWASPEQAEGRQDEVDTRTDVYSLGVMLYQLLTGAFPYEISGSLRETANNIVHCEPRPPREMNRHVDDELATIVLKALRKERELRYQTAGDLARDVDRYLRGLPIEAKRDSLSYIFRKQLARHKLTAGVLTGFVVLVLVGFFVSLTFWRQAVVARDAEAEQKTLAQQNARFADRQAAQADAEAAKARAVSEFLTEMLASASPREGGSDVTVREAVDAAVGRVDAGVLGDQPALEGAVRRTIGTTYHALGLFDEAIAQLSATRELQRDDPQTTPDDALNTRIELAAALRADGETDQAEAILRATLADARELLDPGRATIAQCLVTLAGVLRDRGDFGESERLLREALAIWRDAPPRDESDAAGALNDLAISLEQRGALEEAVATQRAALEHFVRLRGVRHYDTAIVQSNLAGTYVKLGEYEQAEKLYGEALDTLRAAAGEDHPAVASVLSKLGMVYAEQSEFARAEPLLRESLELRRKVLGKEHPLIVNGLNHLAILRYRQGDLDGAAEYYRQAIELFRETRGPDHPGLASLLNNLAAVAKARGDLETTESLLRESLAINLAHSGENDAITAQAYANLAATLADTDRLEEAETLSRDALRIRTALLPGDHPDRLGNLAGLADLLRRRGELDEAETLCRAALAGRRQRLGEDHISIAESLHDLGQILLARGDADQAEATIAQAVRIARDHLPENHWELAVFRAGWGTALLRLERFDEAQATLTASHEALTATRGAGHRTTQVVRDRLCELYAAWGDRPAPDELECAPE